MKTAVWFLVFIVSVGVSAGSPCDKGDNFPWPWGSECPFPWQEIEGAYEVADGPKDGRYLGHFVVFDEIQEDRQGLKFMRVTQYDSRGFMVGEGTGFSQKDKRVVRGILTPVQEGPRYTVLVRSYAKRQGASCRRPEDLVTAITFCPLFGRRCMLDSNYVLETFPRIQYRK